MTLEKIVELTEGQVVTLDFDGSKEAVNGFVGDLLSVVMGKAKEDCAWITIQSHINIVAVASLVDMACIIVAEGFQVDEDAVGKANEEGITIIKTTRSSYETASILSRNGLC